MAKYELLAVPDLNYRGKFEADQHSDGTNCAAADWVGVEKTLLKVTSERTDTCDMGSAVSIPMVVVKNVHWKVDLQRGMEEFKI